MYGHDDNQLDRTDQLWLDGLEAYERGDIAQAGRSWSLAASDDCADALLGLHALEPDNSLLLCEMHQCIDSFGFERSRLRRGLASLYYPGGFQAVALVTQTDLLCALALYKSRCGRQDEAWELLQRANADTPNAYVLLTRLRILFEHGRYHDCLEELNEGSASLPAAHRPEVELMHGSCLLAIGEADKAALILENTCAWLAADREDDLLLHLLYYLAAAYKALGDEDKNTELLVRISECDQEFSDVSTQLGGDDLVWTQIITGLNQGQLATDPAILDNQRSA